MEKARTKDEFDLVMMVSVVDVLCSHGMDKPTAITIGHKITEHFSREYGGTQFYITKRRSAETANKAASIYAEFDGTNYRELAEKYGYTEVWVRQLLKRVKAGKGGTIR